LSGDRTASISSKQRDSSLDNSISLSPRFDSAVRSSLKEKKNIFYQNNKENIPTWTMLISFHIRCWPRCNQR
jgi:hypothetical protein